MGRLCPPFCMSLMKFDSPQPKDGNPVLEAVRSSKSSTARKLPLAPRWSSGVVHASVPFAAHQLWIYGVETICRLRFL